MKMLSTPVGTKNTSLHAKCSLMKDLNSNRGEKTTVSFILMLLSRSLCLQLWNWLMFLKLQGAFTSNHGYCFKTAQKKIGGDSNLRRKTVFLIFIKWSCGNKRLGKDLKIVTSLQSQRCLIFQPYRSSTSMDHFTFSNSDPQKLI